MSKRRRSRPSVWTELIPALILIILLAAAVPSSTGVGTISDMLTPTEVPTPAPTVRPTAVPTLLPTEAPTAEPDAEQSPQPTEAIIISGIETEDMPTAEPETATPEPLPTIRPTGPLHATGEVFDRRGDGTAVNVLPMDDFSGGTEISPDGYSEDGSYYEDESIRVHVYSFKYDYTTYTVADIEIMDPSQLRTAIAGTTKSAARADMTKLAKRVNAVVAINGDYYHDRTGSFIVRQGTVMAYDFSNVLDMLIIDNNGDFHCIYAKDKKEAVKQYEGNIYQAFSFGPALVIDGKAADDPPGYYPFGIWAANPRAAIGQLGPLHYVLVQSAGRISSSNSITCGTLKTIMLKLGCQQAYNLDGGASAQLYYKGDIASPLTPAGKRALYDIIYFASAAKE